MISVSASLHGDSALSAALTVSASATATLGGGSDLTVEAGISSILAIVVADYLPDDGTVLVSFDSDLCIDPVLLSPSSYVFSGPTTVEVRKVRTADSKTVALTTSGLASGDYTITASTSIRNNLGQYLDPSFNQAIIQAAVPFLQRSVFTDHGPIAKPELTLQSGSGGTIQSTPSTFFGTLTLNEVVLPGGVFTTGHVGLYLELGGTSVNGGAYRITGVVSPTRLKLLASFHLPDPDNGSLTWRLYDPRTGEVADSPSDVVVRVNGIIWPAQAVLGLRGQVVLGVAPDPGDTVTVDYSWIRDPTVEVRGLNSKDFRLNNWTTNLGNQNPTQHTYRYRNVLTTPAVFQPSDVLAPLTQPLLRQLYYRAYERAYSAVLNDPNLLLLNSPAHRIAFPPLSREVPEVSVLYLADVLPEVDPIPWKREGSGQASIVSGNLVVVDNTSGPFPSGNPIYWTRGIDLTFPHVYAASWRMKIDSFTPDGVFTGVSTGWSDGERAVVLGFLYDGGMRKIGFLKKGMGNLLSDPSAWTGGVDSIGAPTGLPFNFDWSILHSYRFLQDKNQVVRFYVDGELVESLRITEDELPFLEELNDCFDEVQNVFFGSLSREAMNQSTWDFVQYVVLPLNPEQSIPFIYVDYGGDQLPEEAPSPWTPVGYHGYESLSNQHLIVDSTSATEGEVSLIGGDFRGFTRIEPLLQVSSDVVLDFEVVPRTYTHGVTPNAVMVAIDDSNRLVQVCFLPTSPQPKYSYPGRSLPQDAIPRPWTSLGTAPAVMIGQTLRISDASTTDGRVFALNDLEPPTALTRVLEPSIDYFVECRCQVISSTPDIDGFCGATVDVFDGGRTLGLLLRMSSGVPQAAFHSDGNVLAFFNFNWNDNSPHTYRLTKNTAGDLVVLFVDNNLIGSFPYTSFLTTLGTPTISFGSSTAMSSAAISVVDWFYVNTWRAQPTSGVRRYVGIWKGIDSSSLLNYHLPLKRAGSASVAGNTLTDGLANFGAAGLVPGDDLLVDYGPNQGTYSVQTVSPTVLTITGVFPISGGVDYRVPSQIDWTAEHKYRVVRDPGGTVVLLLDAETAPRIRVDYNEINLPPSSAGIPCTINRRLPSITWGALDPTNLSQTAWGFIRYGVSRSPEGTRTAPHHQLLNQRNVMSSPEHLYGTVPHNHTQYSSSSTGVPYPWEDFVNNPAVRAFTQLNEGTPLVPSTQTYEVRRPTPQRVFLSSLNNPNDVLNSSSGFSLNDSTSEVRILVPDDVLYDQLQVVEKTDGIEDQITPLSDSDGPEGVSLFWQKTIVATYDGTVLPENDPNFGTSWTLESVDPSEVSTTVAGGILTYAVGPGPTQTVYRNPNPLPDSIGLTTTADFRLRLLNDSTSGAGDTGVRFGFSAFGLTAALAFIAAPTGEREVHLLDLNSNAILGSISVDYSDGLYHTYRLVKNVEEGTVDFLVDP